MKLSTKEIENWRAINIGIPVICVICMPLRVAHHEGTIYSYGESVMATLFIWVLTRPLTISGLTSILRPDLRSITTFCAMPLGLGPGQLAAIFSSLGQSRNGKTWILKNNDFHTMVCPFLQGSMQFLGLPSISFCRSSSSIDMTFSRWPDQVPHRISFLLARIFVLIAWLVATRDVSNVHTKTLKSTHET